MITSGPSRRTRGYYWGALVPLIREHCGYWSDVAAHRAIKAGFYEMDPRDPNLPSMRNMSQEEAGLLIDYAIVQSAELGLVLPDPRTVEEK